MMYYELDGKKYEIIIERKIGQKNTYIRVKKDLCIHVTCGKFTPVFAIKGLINSNKDRLKDMIYTQERKKVNNDGFYYLGNRYDIEYNDSNKIEFIDDKVYIGKNYDIDIFYKEKAKELFSERIEYLYDNYSRKIPHPKLRIRKMKTRWGVCNIKTHNITLNLELIKRDTKYLDYVIIHELTHLVHGDHSSAFWRVVEENMPNYKDIKKDMRDFL